MSHSLPPRSERSSRAPDLPPELAGALEAARSTPESEEVWDTLDDACRDLDRPEEGAALYSEVMDSTAELEVRVTVGLRAADFCEEWFEDTDPVIEMLGRVLEMEPGHADAFERLTVLLTVSSRWSDLLKAYDKAIESASDEDSKAQLLEEAAKVARDFAGEAQRGSDYLKALLLLRLDDEQLAANVERRLDEQGRHQDLIDVWTARLSVLDAASSISTRLAIATRQADALHEAASALASIEAFLAAEGTAADCTTLLDRIAEADWASVEERREALARLEKIFVASEEWPHVVSVLERELGISDTDEAKAALHGRISELLQQTGEAAAALEHAHHVMRLSPGNEQARERARDMARELGALDTFAAALVVAADAADAALGDEGGARRVELLLEAAQLSNHELGLSEQALGFYARLADDAAADDAAKLLACQELSVLLEQADRHPELLSYLERQADLETKAGERAAVLGRAARLADQLEDLERSLKLWSLRLTDDEDDLEALGEKIVLLERTRHFQGLVEALEARATISEDQDANRADLVKAAGVHLENLGDVAGSISTWQQIEASFGQNDETVDELVRLLLRAERHQDVAELLQTSIKGLSSETVDERVARRVAQLGALGETQRLHLEDNESALTSYAEALDVAPSDELARAGLRALLLSPQLAHKAGEKLASALRAAGDLQEIVDLVEIRLGAGSDDSFRAAVLREAAEIQEQSESAADALQSLRRAFALEPSSATEQEMLRLAEAIAGWNVVSEAYSEAIAKVEEDERKFSLQLSRGHIEEDRLAQPAPAASCYEAALTLNPEDEGTARDLIRAALKAELYREGAWGLVEFTRASEGLSDEMRQHFEECAVAAGDWEEILLALADRIASAELDAGVAHDLKRQLAIWHRDQAEDPDSAELVLRRAVADYPREDSLRMLAELQRRAPGRRLVETLLTLADIASDELACLHEAGNVALEQVQESEFAEPILVRAFEKASAEFKVLGVEGAAEARSSDEKPSEAEMVTAWAVDHLVTLAVERSESKRAVALLEESAALPFAEEEKITRRFRAAEMAAQGGMDDQAVELGQLVLEAQPSHSAAITLLAQLHEKAGRLDQLIDLLARELALEPPVERRLFLRLESARVLGTLGRDLGERRQALEGNIADSPGHAETVETLSGLLLEAELFEDVASLFESQAEAISSSEPERAAELWGRAGALAEERLEDLERLARDYKAAVVLKATARPLDRLAELCHDAEQWDAEVSWLEQRLALTPGADESAEAAEERRGVVLRLATALRAADEAESARQLLERELEADPAADESRRVLSELCEHFEDYAALAELLVAGVEFAPDDAGKIDYLKRAATVRRQRLGQLEAAVPLLRDALSLAPDDRALKLEMADCLRESGGYEEAGAILGSLLEEFGRRRTKEKAAVHLLLARIARAAGQVDEALSQAEEAAKIDRTDAATLMLVAQLAKEKGQLERAEQAYRTLALIVGRKSGASESVGESAILFELYQLATERGDDGQARELMDSALEIATRSSAEALRLEESLRAVGQSEVLLQALDAQLAGAEGVAASKLLVTRATIFEKNERYEDAFQSRLRALHHLPDDERLIEASRKLADRLGQTQVLWGHLQGLAEQNSERPEVAGALWLRLGRAAESAEDDARAAELYEAAQKTGHRPRRVYVSLDSVLKRLGDQERRHASIRRFVETPGADGTPDVYSDALYRLAHIEFTAGEGQTATDYLNRALEVQGDNARALEIVTAAARGSVLPETAVPVFVKLARSGGEGSALLFALGMAAALPDATEELVVEAVELARTQEDTEALTRLLARRIELAEQAGELEGVAAEMLELAELRLSAGEPARTAKLLLAAAPLLEGEERLSAELRAAGLLAAPLGRADDAAAIYERLFEAEPGERRVWQPLLELYRQAGREDAVEAAVIRAEEHAHDDEDRELLRMARIRLMVSAGRLEEAEEALRETLEEKPESSEAAEILVDLLRRAERFDEQKELLESLYDQARTREDGSQVAQYGLQLVELLGEDREEAISVLTAGLDVTRQSADVLRKLLSLYTDEDDPGDRAEVIEYLIPLEEDAAARSLINALIELRRADGDEYGLGRALELGYASLPGDEGVEAAYVEHLRSQDDYPRLCEVLVAKAEHATDASLAAATLADVAEMYESQLGEPTRAAEAMKQAFAKQPDDVTFLQRGVQYLVSAGEVDDALQFLAGALESADDMILADLLDTRSQVIEQERSDEPELLRQAAEDVSRALDELLPEEQEVELQQRRVRILAALRQLYADQADEEREREMVVQLAEVYTSRDEGAQAVETLSAWLGEHPSDAELALRMGQLAEAAADYPNASFAYRLLFDATDGDARRDAVLRLAAAAEAQGEPMQAQEPLEEVFSERPDDAEVRAKVCAMYEAVGAFRQLAEILQAEADRAEQPETRFALLVQVGDLYLKAEDGAAACEVFEIAREFAPDIYLITGKLADSYVGMGEIERAQEVLDAALAEHGKRRTPELALLQWALARVAEARGDMDGMFGWFEAALMSDRNNGEVASELAIRAQDQGRHEIAIKALQVLTLSKGEAPIGKAEAYYRQAQIALELGDTKKALLLARRAVQADGSFSPAQEMLSHLG